jgi:hypothetical protein
MNIVKIKRLNIASKMINAVGYITAAGAPVAVTASQFPIWTHSDNGQTLSGAFLLACFLGAIPILALLWRKRKELKKYVSFAPIIISASLWGILSALEPILPQLKFILMVSTAGEGAALGMFGVGAGLSKLSARKKEEAIQIIADELEAKTNE